MAETHTATPNAQRLIVDHSIRRAITGAQRNAERSDYPLFGTCEACGEAIMCADGTADWSHALDLLAFYGVGTPRAAVEASSDIRQLGVLTRQVYEGFLAAGFGEVAALQLTTAWVGAMWAKATA